MCASVCFKPFGERAHLQSCTVPTLRGAHVLPSADDKASHQEDEENDPPGDGHGQNGGLVRVPNRKNV